MEKATLHPSKFTALRCVQQFVIQRPDLLDMDRRARIVLTVCEFCGTLCRQKDLLLAAEVLGAAGALEPVLLTDRAVRVDGQRALGSRKTCEFFGASRLERWKPQKDDQLCKTLLEQYIFPNVRQDVFAWAAQELLAVEPQVLDQVSPSIRAGLAPFRSSSYVLLNPTDSDKTGRYLSAQHAFLNWIVDKAKAKRPIFTPLAPLLPKNLPLTMAVLPQIVDFFLVEGNLEELLTECKKMAVKLDEVPSESEVQHVLAVKVF